MSTKRRHQSAPKSICVETHLSRLMESALEIEGSKSLARLAFLIVWFGLDSNELKSFVSRKPKGHQPVGHARVLVLNTLSGSLSTIDPTRDSVVSTLSVGEEPRDLAFAPPGRVFVTVSGSNEVAVIDSEKEQLLRLAKAGVRPGHIYLHPASREVWVANDASENLTVLDAGTGEHGATIPVGAGHHKIAFTSDGAFAFATNIRDGSVTMVDGRRHIALAAIEVGKAPHGIAVSHDNRLVFVCNNGDERVSVIGVSERGVVTDIFGPQGPNYARVSPDGRLAFVVHKCGVLSVIDIEALTVKRVLQVGKVPERVVFHPEGKLAFINNTRSGDVTAIDTQALTVVGQVTVEAGGSHQGMTFSPDGSRLYVVNHGAGSVSVLDVRELRLLRRVEVGRGPSNIITIAPVDRETKFDR